MKKKIIERVRGGIFSTHAGILPNFRGVDTNKWSILSGNKFVGITLYKLDEGVDTGKIIKVIKYKYKGNFKNHTEINKDLYYNYKLYLLLDLIKNLSKGKKISYKKNKKNFSQFFKMSKKNTKIVNYKLNTN